jgi:hypothetical protein
MRMLDRRQFLALTLAGLALPAWARTKMSRFGVRIAHAALDQVGLTRSYDPAYRALDYPGGDVPIDTGVCADVVVLSIKSDHWIRRMAAEQGMIEPFEPGQVRIRPRQGRDLLRHLELRLRRALRARVQDLHQHQFDDRRSEEL